ncbi:uncharacterized protein [Antedon mediterranea]|uniref:uncharacterized protein n=1 Tax=Antedon mediterranea TaxID=105859 RepID=UPI003AF6AE7B
MTKTHVAQLETHNHVCAHRLQQNSGIHKKRSKHSNTDSLGNFSMQDCFEKLREIVPTIPKDRKLSQVEILQHVIDYIQDLQSELEKQNISFCGIRSGSTNNRNPLTSLSLQNTPDRTAELKEKLAKALEAYETPESSPLSSPCGSC